MEIPTWQCYMAEMFLACSLGRLFLLCLNQNLYTKDPETHSDPSCYQQLSCMNEGPAMPDPSPQAVSAAESTNENRRKIDYVDLLGEKKNQQNDGDGEVRSIPGVYYFSDLLGPYEPMCEILHPPSTSLLERMAWVRVSKPMWLPLLHFIKKSFLQGEVSSASRESVIPGAGGMAGGQ